MPRVLTCILAAMYIAIPFPYLVGKTLYTYLSTL